MNAGVVIPCYKEHESIAHLIHAARAVRPDLIVVVVDDSPDERTAEAVRPLTDARTVLIRRRAKGGRGSAVIDGLKALAALDVDVALEMDADFSHPPEQIPALIDGLVERRLDVLIASRYIAGSRIVNWPLARRIFSSASNIVARRVLSVPVSDYTNGFRCYSRVAVTVILSECGRLGAGFIALSEILVNTYYRGLRVGEVPTTFVNRARGESSLDRREITGAIRGLVAIRGLKTELRRAAAR